MRAILWTERAQSDLAAIHALISQDSTPYAALTVRQLIAAVDQLAVSPESGRAVPEFEDPQVREIVRRAHRIVYRMVADDHEHVLRIHHGSRQLPLQF